MDLRLDLGVVALGEAAADLHAVVQVHRACLLYVHLLHNQERYALNREIQSNPLNTSPDNGSIRLKIQSNLRVVT